VLIFNQKKTPKHVGLKSRNRILAVSTSVHCINGFEFANHIGQNRNSWAEPSTTVLPTYFKFESPAFSPAQLTSTDPKQHTTKNTRNLLQIIFVLTENKESLHQTWPSRLFGCISPTNSAFSRPIGAALPHDQHVREFDIFCEVLAHQ
jgi:hypothetical protein